MEVKNTVPWERDSFSSEIGIARYLTGRAPSEKGSLRKWSSPSPSPTTRPGRGRPQGSAGHRARKAAQSPQGLGKSAERAGGAALGAPGRGRPSAARGRAQGGREPGCAKGQGLVERGQCVPRRMPGFLPALGPWTRADPHAESYHPSGGVSVHPLRHLLCAPERAPPACL